ncbi:MAG: thioesterase family protein [Anaerolineae bacterium]
MDAFGHVNNGVIFTYVETARVRYIAEVGIRLPQTGWHGLSFILAHINCDFRRPIFYGQKVEVGSRIVEIGRSSFKLEHRVEADGELAAEGYGVIVHYDYAAGRSVPLSDELRAKIEAFEGLTFERFVEPENLS